jgi:hypothetical protein
MAHFILMEPNVIRLVGCCCFAKHHQPPTNGHQFQFLPPICFHCCDPVRASGFKKYILGKHIPKKEKNFLNQKMQFIPL